VYHYGGALPFERWNVYDGYGEAISGQYVFFVGNQAGTRFAFHKADDRISNEYYWPTINDILLPGAQFRLFRTNVPTAQVTPPLGTGDSGLVTINAGLPNTPWEEVTLSRNTSTDNADEPIYFTMAPGFTYQLVEVAAPAGFQTPLGQWRIVVDSNAPGGFTITNIGGVAMPGFQRIPGSDPLPPDHVEWFLGNWQQMYLPLAGGGGRSTFTMAGAMALGIAGLMVSAIVIKKGKVKG